MDRARVAHAPACSTSYARCQDARFHKGGPRRGSHTGGLRSGRAQAAGPPSKEVQAQSAAVPWTPETEAVLQSLDDWEPKAYEPAAPAPGSQAERAGAPLKINRDLLLYQARLQQRAAWRAPSLGARRGHDAKAERLLLRCLGMCGADGRIYVGLGKLWQSQGKIDEARHIYEQGCMATGGQNAHLWQAWGTLEARQGKVAKARKLFDAAIVAHPAHAAAWHAWGMLEKKQGNLMKARDLWLKGIRATRDSPNPHLYQSLAVLAGDMGFTAEARQWFREGTRFILGVSSHALWHSWAVMEARQGDKEVVRYLFRRGLRANPRSRYIHLAWAVFEKAQGQRQNARRLLARGRELNPCDTAILQALALLEEEDGDLDAARTHLKTALKFKHQDLYCLQAWGVLEWRAGNPAAARALFQRAVWAAPRERAVALAWQAWAVLEADAGNYKLARQLFRAAVKADPDSEKSWLAWANMEDEVGQPDRAAELRGYRMQERCEVVRPASFGALPADAVADAPFDKVLTMIASWFAKVQSSSAVAQRPAPSYTYVPAPASGAGGTETGPRDAVPDMAAMAALDNAELGPLGDEMDAWFPTPAEEAAADEVVAGPDAAENEPGAVCVQA